MTPSGPPVSSRSLCEVPADGDEGASSVGELRCEVGEKRKDKQCQAAAGGALHFPPRRRPFEKLFTSTALVMFKTCQCG